MLASFEQIGVSTEEYSGIGGSTLIGFSGFDVFEQSSKQQVVSALFVDDEQLSSYVTYEDGNAEVCYSDIEVLGIMQAQPVYEEVDDGSYLFNSNTSHSKSSGSDAEETDGYSLSAGVVMGFFANAPFGKITVLLSTVVSVVKNISISVTVPSCPPDTI